MMYIRSHFGSNHIIGTSTYTFLCYIFFSRVDMLLMLFILASQAEGMKRSRSMPAEASMASRTRQVVQATPKPLPRRITRSANPNAQPVPAVPPIVLHDTPSEFPSYPEIVRDFMLQQQAERACFYASNADGNASSSDADFDFQESQGCDADLPPCVVSMSRLRIPIGPSVIAGPAAPMHGHVRKAVIKEEIVRNEDGTISIFRRSRPETTEERQAAHPTASSSQPTTSSAAQSQWTELDFRQ